MAGATSVKDAPYPTGDKSFVEVRLGGHVIEGASADTQVDTWIAPWDCKVIGVYRHYTKTSTNDLDGIKLRTIDSSKKTIVAALDASADLAGVSQTLHADIVGFNIVRGNGIELLADASDTTEGGIIRDTIRLVPTYG